MTTQETEALKKLPRERLSKRLFDSLPEYSTTDPTGVYPGKVWKRDLHAAMWDWGRGRLIRPNEAPLWVLCEYVRSKPGHCAVKLRVPVVVE